MGSSGVCGFFSTILWVSHFVSWDWLNFYLDILSVYPFIWVCFKCEKCGHPC